MSSLEVPQSNKPSFHRGSFAEEIDHARHDLAKKMLDGESPSGSPSTSGSVPSLSPTHSATPGTPDSGPLLGKDLIADSFAFAFDIDGVLIRGGRPIPEAIEAMKVLNGQNKYNMKM
jgi:hypothetical protein